MIPVIDIFAGPGGLGEGFSSREMKCEKGRRFFEIALSIEKDVYAHQTLTLRSFFRQFRIGQVPENYYRFLRGEIKLNELYDLHPKEALAAREEAWQVTLGDSRESVPKVELDSRIKKALNGRKNWLLIGGPPCQAYSIVGRSRRQETVLNEKKDERVGLYKQYLRILAVHNPTVFVMENVKGLLSAETHKNSVFEKILEDLSDPVTAFYQDYGKNGRNLDCPGYKIYSLSDHPSGFDENGNPIYKQTDYVVQAEDYGIPQTRHRVILLGIRNDIEWNPEILQKKPEVGIKRVLEDLPKLRSSLSRQKDDDEVWMNAVNAVSRGGRLKGVESGVQDEIIRQLNRLASPRFRTGGMFVPTNRVGSTYEGRWFNDERIKGVCNHEARGHMESDLWRYFFVSCFGRVKKQSPRLEDFPKSLLPNHGNVKQGIEEKKFADRFRVQLETRPAKTITSHISKDGHYYIHYDPLQCRSLTVREAARIQTFPDNYFFCGPRTEQYSQVGNAVPPLLAHEIAGIVQKIFEQRLKPAKTSGQKADRNGMQFKNTVSA